ncbi:MAG: aminoacyl-tRNA hydrolase [Bacillota bacterium]
MPIRLLIGLGNPGERYRQTRHNAGFVVLERLDEFRRTRWRSGCGGRWSEAEIRGCPVLLFEPQSYMNLSGEPVARMLGRGYTPGEILVICDDMDLPLGRVRLRPGGGSGGHRGLASIARELGTNEFPRLRVGIGRPGENVDARDYVLQSFGAEERDLADLTLDLAVRAVICAVASGIEEAMNAFNGVTVRPEGAEDE